MSEWYYADASGAQVGPVSFDDLSEQVRSGAVTADQKAWTEGMADWQAVGEISELASLVPAATAAASPVASAAPNPYQSPTSPASSPAAQSAPPENWLWQSIVVTLLCCLPLGIVGIVFASKVNTLWMQGSYPEANEAAANAKKWTVIGFWVGLAVNVIGGVLYFVMGAAAVAGSGEY